MDRRLYKRYCALFLATATLLWLAPSGKAQAQQQNQNPPARAYDRDITTWEVASFFDFLNVQPKSMREDLNNDPKLLTNQEYLQSHPDLQTYLQQHPTVREEANENPNAFMTQEKRYASLAFRSDADDYRAPGDRRRNADDGRDLDRDINRSDRDRDMDRRDNDANAGRDFDRDRDGTRVRNRGELARFDQFLDSHRETAEQLRRNPSLASDQQFVKSHPALQTFLQNNPGVRQQLTQNPDAFMQRENRYDAREDARNADFDRRDRDDVRRDMDNRQNQGRGVRDRDDAVRDRDDAVRDRDDARRENNNPQGVRDRDTTRGQLASFDRFLDSHHETAEQLRRNPSLVNNQQFVQNHPALQAYLQQNPQVREEITENPNVFMRQENQFDRREDMDRGRAMQAANFREFLGGHASMSQELSRDPSKANDPMYQQKHPELQTYLKAHPDVQTALNQNPQSFMKSVQQPATTGTTGTTTGTTGSTTGTTKPPTGTTGTGTTGTTGTTKPAPQPPKQ